MKNENIRFKGRIIVFLLIISLFVFLAPLQNDTSLVQAATGLYSEDFSTTTFMDGINTNATGWGDDSISIARKQPIIIGTLSKVLSGNILDIYVDGNYAYCGTLDNKFLTINITNPYFPSKKNSCSIDGIGYSVSVDGNYAYVAANDQGLKVVNITEPGSPHVIGSFNTDGNARDAVIKGDYAFVADGSYGLKVIDISDPTLPTSGVTWTYDTPDVATGVVVEGDYAYITDTSSIQIIDVSDPTSPLFAGEYDAITSANKLSLFGDIAFIANSDGLVIINVTKPQSPQYLGTFGAVGLTDLVLDGDYIYAADYDYYFQIIDISNPLNPVEVGSCLMPALSQGLFLSGCNVYAAPYDLGLRVIEVTDINEELSYKDLVSSLSGYSLEGVQQMCIKGDYLFIAETKGLLILNISVPEIPRYVSSYTYTSVPDSPIYIAVEGNYAYLSGRSTDRLVVVNVTDITSPTLAGSCSTPGMGWDIEISGNYLFMADWNGGLHSIDISDPTNPVIVDTYTLDGYSSLITISGDYLYLSVASGLSVNGLLIFDISDPTSIAYLNTYSVTNPRKLSIRGDYGYLAADDEGLIILDMSDPSDPKYSNSTVFNDAWDVKISGDYAFFTRIYGGFFVSDISNPTELNIIDNHGTSSVQERFIEFHGDYAYVSSTSNGFKIYEIKKSKAKQYDSPCVAQSMEIYSAANHILNATLISNASTPLDTDIEYYLSADNGVHWEQVTNNSLHYFTNKGYQLKWKAELTSQNVSYTPTLYSLEIEYVSFLEAPELLTPENPSADFDHTPTFTWLGIDGEIGYLFQLDTSTDFVTPIINITLPSTSTSYTPDNPLTSGNKYWRVAGIDSNGELGLFSGYYVHSILIESIDPNIDHPSDITYELGHTGNEITWHPTDENPATYSILVESVTQISHADWNGGIITYNVDGYSEGAFGVQCFAYDADGNYAEDNVQVNVITPESPIIDDVADFEYEAGDTGNNISWHPSDSYPDYYSITRNGLVVDDGPWLGGDIYIDIDGLAYGVYTYVCTVNDTDGLEATDTVIITVTDNINPNLNSPAYVNYNEGETGNNIIWIATDSHPATYTVYKDGTLYETDTWTSGSSIIVSIDGLTTGLYNFTIVVYDQAGNIAKNTVMVDVNPAIPEFNQKAFFYIICIMVVISFNIRKPKIQMKS